jgi:hypothetical protein
VTKIVSPVSSVIKAENFVVNRILEITPLVDGEAVKVQVSANLRLAGAYYQTWSIWQFIALNRHSVSMSEYSLQKLFSNHHA